MASVNLYDPETMMGSVWREEDAPAKIAEGYITEEEYKARCAAKAEAERQEWLTSEDTLPERFSMLRRARDAKIAEWDYYVLADYPDVGSAMKTAVLEYRQALRDLPSQEGAPWDGGGELTPWPDDPRSA